MTAVAILLGCGIALGFCSSLGSRTRGRSRPAAASNGRATLGVAYETPARARAGRSRARRNPLAGRRDRGRTLGMVLARAPRRTPAREAGVARTEAIATWTEMLRDTIAAAHGLEAAIAATSPVAPEPVRREVLALVEPHRARAAPGAAQLARRRPRAPDRRPRRRVPEFAATESVRELTDLLGTLAQAAHDEAAMQLRIEAAHARMRTAVRVITGCTVLTAAGLVALNPSYVTSYSSAALGQTTLALISVCWGVALWWLAPHEPVPTARPNASCSAKRQPREREREPRAVLGGGSGPASCLLSGIVPPRPASERRLLVCTDLVQVARMRLMAICSCA